MVKKSTVNSEELSRSFGFDPKESQHHFLVNIPRGSTQPIEVSEHFTWSEDSGSGEVSYSGRVDGQIRISLPRLKWDAMADEIRAEFNQRLRKMGKKLGTWRVGHNLVRRELGKELVLLCWATEDADPGLIPNAVANWKGLVPEERWWLYTQTAAATGHGITDRGKGWRKAVRYALTENPVTTRPPDRPLIPEFFRDASQPTLFEDMRESTPPKGKRKR
jgi:hypothetical protein